MKKVLLKGLLAVALTVFFNVINVQGQTLKLDPKTFSMTISGTTNVHNFKSKVTVASGQMVIGESKKVQSLTVVIPVKGIKSGESLMDKKTYETFNEPKYPEIIFKMTDVDNLQVAGSQVTANVSGNLSMNGVTRKIVLRATGKMIKPGTYEFTGSIPVKMTDFKMSPPTAMLGMMKVGDTVTLSYSVIFEGAPLK